MIERKGLFFDPSEWLCVPVSGNMTNSKFGPRLVMGGDISYHAKKRHPGIDLLLGSWVLEHGNVPCVQSRSRLISFPIKWHHKDPPDPALIFLSAQKLMVWACREDPEIVCMPRISCSKSGVLWTDIRPTLEILLDDRFVVLCPA